MQAVILAGGLGIRLRPLTYEMPKPMVPVLGKPMLGYIIEMLKARGFDSFVICSSYMSERIRDYFKSGKKLGVKIEHSVETTPLGTAGAIRNAFPYLKDTFFAINGDTYLDIDYKKIYDVFEQEDKPALMVLYAGNEIKERVDNVTVDKRGIVKSYNKGKKTKSKYGFAGVLLLKKKLVEKWVSGKQLSLESEIFPELIKNKQMASFAVQTRYYDIGTIEKVRDFEGYLQKNILKESSK